MLKKLLDETGRGAAVLSIALLAVLLLPVWVFPGDDDDPAKPAAERAVKRVRKDTMAPDAADQVTAGYYEDLFDHSSRTISTNRLITGKWATNWSRYKGLQMNPTNRRVPGFLYYELEPNVNQREFDGTLVTNRYGMADREYAVEPPDGVRRISFIGDSITRGLGATHGHTFEALLEGKLNAAEAPEGVAGYEALNFAVGGYRITQMLHVVRTKAAEFSPDVHVVVFTDLTAFRKWGDHLVQLVHDGVDLEYDYLRELVDRAELRPDDDPQTFDAKLEPFRFESVRWALETMKAAAAEQGAEIIVVMVPTVLTQDVIRERFEGVEDLIRSTGIPVVNVTDTFADYDDLSPYKIGPRNNHPTDPGHALLADRIWERLRENPEAWRIVTGADAPAL
jgi:lysophospholipase L1-like esterase